MDTEIPKTEDEFVKQRRKIEQRQEKILFYSRILLVLTAVLLIISFFLEGWSTAKTRQVALEPVTAPDSSEANKDFEPQIITDVSLVFPAEITGYATKARQVVPGSGGKKAEAVYEPLDMDLQLKAPTSVYCEINYFDNFHAMQDFVSKKMSEFPLEQETRLIQDKTVKTGYSTDKNAYTLILDEKNYVLWVKALFTVSDPVEKGNYLKIHGEKVMENIIKHMIEVESGAAID